MAARGTRVQLAIAVWEWGAVFGADQRMKGLNMAWAKWRRPHPQTAPTASKAAGLHMIGTMSREAAIDEGADDAMMLDWKGDLAEATGAKVFFVFAGELPTPKPECFLDGITRRSVMELARKRQMKVVERVIHPDELAGASKVLLAGTAAEVTPVRRIGTQDFTPGLITETLMKDFEALVHRRI